MNSWFGIKHKPWGKLCHQMPYVETPVGQICSHCEEAIEQGDEGEMMPHVESETATLRPIHRECLLRSIMGSVGHQRRACPCYGGTEEDPPGTTKRQAAIMAADLFDETTGLLTPQRAWSNHRDNCETCNKAMKGRFVQNVTMHMMWKRCCEVGKPLYKAFIYRLERKDISKDEP